MSPTSIAAIAAFQTAGLRKRVGTRDEVMDEAYEREREREIAVQKDRQRRIRDRAPGRKPTAHKLGDIDGMLPGPMPFLRRLGVSYSFEFL